MTDDTLEAAARDIAHAGPRGVVAFTGAGVSTESGIPDFRSPGGLWDTYDPSEFTIRRFREDPARYWELRGRLMEAMDLDSIEPNPAHEALATLEETGLLRSVVTQNIDGLHQAAGNAHHRVLEVHGSAREVVCVACGERYPYEVAREALDRDVRPPPCPTCGGALKPGTVLFGEALPQDVFKQAREHARDAEVFIVVGSSLGVYPAADLPRIAKAQGAVLVIVNRDPTPQDELADHVLHGEAGTIVPKLVERGLELRDDG